ncbi:hypothetical protein F8S13_01090 [Chloroflexia bacterium SDU3-3]|nr:hypothetical protein F8S13_01090 [Chloroflexia bacterium SDU3-3]
MNTTPSPLPLSARAQSWENRFAITTVAGGLLLLVSGALAVLAEWLTGWPIIRPWLQISAACAGVVALLSAVYRPQLGMVRRCLRVFGGLMLLGWVLDSLDGRLDLLPIVLIFLLIWAIDYADKLPQLLQDQQLDSLRRWAAIGLAAGALLVYLGAAAQYFVSYLGERSTDIWQHPLFPIAPLISIAISWLGKRPPYNK